MATSIARLAILINVDADKLRAGLQATQTQLKAMDKAASESGGGISSAIQGAIGRFVTLEKVISAVKREFAFFFKVATDAQDRMAELTNASKLETWRGQWERFTDNLGNAFLPQINTATKLFDELLNRADQLRTGFFGLESRDHERLRLQALADIQKKFAEDQKRAAEERQRQLEREAAALARLKNHADDITKSLRNPNELLKDALKELDELLRKGLITQETFNRGQRRATDEFREQARAALELKHLRVGAAEAGSQADISARLAANTNATINANVNNQLAAILQANQQNNALVQKQINQPPVRLIAGNF